MLDPCFSGSTTFRTDGLLLASIQTMKLKKKLAFKSHLIMKYVTNPSEFQCNGENVITCHIIINLLGN